jgi:hypothetical protein
MSRWGSCWGPGRSAHDRLIVLLLARAGLRRSEAVGLRRPGTPFSGRGHVLGARLTPARGHGHGGQSDWSVISGVQDSGGAGPRLTEWISLGLSSGAFRVSRRSRRSLNRHHSERRHSVVPRQVKFGNRVGCYNPRGFRWQHSPATRDTAGFPRPAGIHGDALNRPFGNCRSSGPGDRPDERGQRAEPVRYPCVGEAAGSLHGQQFAQGRAIVLCGAGEQEIRVIPALGLLPVGSIPMFSVCRAHSPVLYRRRSGVGERCAHLVARWSGRSGPEPRRCAHRGPTEGQKPTQQSPSALACLSTRSKVRSVM